jgi:hypothetical protein
MARHPNRYQSNPSSALKTPVKVATILNGDSTAKSPVSFSDDKKSNHKK